MSSNKLLSQLHLCRHGITLRQSAYTSFGRNKSSVVCSSPLIHTTLRAMASQAGEPTLNLDNLNPCIKVMEYAVRGPLVARAGEIEKELEKVSALQFFLNFNSE